MLVLVLTLHTISLGDIGALFSRRALSYVPQPCTVREVYRIVCAPTSAWDSVLDKMEPGIILESKVWRWPWQRDYLTVAPREVTFGSRFLIQIDPRYTNRYFHFGGVFVRPRGIREEDLWPHKVFPPLVKINLNLSEPVGASHFAPAILTEKGWPKLAPDGQLELSKAIANLVNRPSIGAPWLSYPRIEGERLPDLELMSAIHDRSSGRANSDTDKVAVSIIATGYAVAYDHRRRETRGCVIGVTTLLWLVGLPLIVRWWRCRALAPWSAQFAE